MKKLQREVKDWMTARSKEVSMKSSERDKAEGWFHAMKGKVKEAAGQISGDNELEAEGTGEKVAGEVQEKVGEIKKVLGK